MYPDLSYIFHALFGTPPDNALSIVKTFGFFLVLAILTAALLLYLEMRRKEKEGLLKPTKVKITEGQPATPTEIGLNGIFGFILGFKFLYIVFNFSEFQLDPAGLILSAKGHLLGGILGGALFAYLKYWEKNREKLDKPKSTIVDLYPHQRIGDITVLAAISGIVGANLFTMFEDITLVLSDKITWEQFFASFFSGSGLTIYGGLIVAFFVVYCYVKKKNIDPIHMMDAVAPALIVAYGVGRLGCHFSGDGDWGIVSNLMDRPSALAWLPDWIWSFDYPHNVNRDGIPIEGCEWLYCNKLEQPVYPTPVYEFWMAISIGAILWALRKRIKIPGLLFFLYVFLNGFERFWIEKIRVNRRADILGISTTQAEFIAILLMLVGLVAMLILWQRHRRKTKIAN